jgi:hypothetical protein
LQEKYNGEKASQEAVLTQNGWEVDIKNIKYNIKIILNLIRIHRTESDIFWFINNILRTKNLI